MTKVSKSESAAPAQPVPPEQVMDEFFNRAVDMYYEQKDGCSDKGHNAYCGKICVECVAAELRARASSPAVAPAQQVVCHKCGESFIFKRDGNRLLAFVRGHNCAAPAVAGRTQRDQLAKALWDSMIAEERHKGSKQDWAQWPEDAARQPYCKSTFRQADFILAALRESASLNNPSESETKAAKLKLYDLWCQAGSEDFTQWLAEKAIELFAGRESASEAPSDDELFTSWENWWNKNWEAWDGAETSQIAVAFYKFLRSASPEAPAAPQPYKVFGLTYETRNTEYVMDAEMFQLLRDHSFTGRAVDAFQEGIKAGRIVTAPAATKEK